MSAIISALTSGGGFCLISAFITCCLGFFVLAQKPSSTVHRLFFAVMISAAYWAAGEFFIWQADSPEGILFWLKFSSFWPMTIAFGSHFILEFTGTFREDERRHIILAGIYIVALALSLVGLFTDCLFTVVFSPGTGYVYIPMSDDPICLAEIMFTAFIMLWSLAVGFISWRYTDPGIKHSQNRLVFAGIITVVFFGALSGIILPLMHIYTPNLVFIGFVIMSFLTVYTIWKYGLFVLSPETVVPEIMKTIPDGLVIINTKGDIIAANESAGRIFPLLKDSPVGKSSISLVYEEDYKTLRSTILEKEEVSDFEVVPPGDSTRSISISGSIVRDRAGVPSGVVFIARDITERKASENALRVANDKLSLLSRITRHDISNLVTALSGYISLLDDRLKDPEERQYLEKSTEIIDLIIKQIDFSRSYQDIGSEKPRWWDLESQVQGAGGSLLREDIKITLEIENVLIYADPLLEKVFYSLIENAVRHGEKITEIIISTEEQEDGSLVIKIKDDGVGIPDDEKEKIFRYGYGKNTGFGLAFARELLSVTGIEISETGVLGEGAVFEIHVPKNAWKPRPSSVNDVKSGHSKDI